MGEIDRARAVGGRPLLLREMDGTQVINKQEIYQELVAALE